MRWLALALILATGCDQVFGIHGTRHIDAAPFPDAIDAPPDAMWLPIVFDEQLGTTDSSGAPLPAMQLPFTSPPTIQVGPAGGTLQTLAYDSSIPGVRVPPEVVAGQWRFVYTLSGDPVPTEIQWAVSSAHLTVPALRRIADAPPPMNSGYSIAPSGTAPAGWPSTMLDQPMIVTSGAYTDSTAGSAAATMNFRYDTGAVPLLGDIGSPHAAMGDWVALIDRRVQNPTNPLILATVGYAITTASDLTGGALTPSAPTWGTTTSTNDVTVTDPSGRMNQVGIGSLGGACCTYHLDYGLLPNPHITPMSERVISSGTNYYIGAQPPRGVELPVLVSLLSYHNNAPPTQITLVDPPTTAIALPRAYYMRAARPRTVSFTSLETSVQELSLGTSFNFAAPLSLGVKFAGVDLTTGAPISVPASTGPMMLTWNNEVSYSADDYAVTLYQVSSGTLKPIARYQVLTPSVTVDGSLFQANITYVFAIVSRNGLPGVKGPSPDYTTVSLPFSEATTFPLEFTVK